jgi:hypothetical protein
MLIAAALAAACSRGAELAPSSSADRPHAAAKGSPPPEKPKARLVVVVVIDQLPSWALARYLPLLDPGGALRSAVDRGAYFGRVVIPFAATYTAPGHAAIHTGAPPSQNGIAANETWSDKTRSEVSIVADQRYPGLDDPGTTASPAALLVPTVAVRPRIAWRSGSRSTAKSSRRSTAATPLRGRRIGSGWAPRFRTIRAQSNAPLDQRRIAATIAALLGVPAPNGGKPLFEERGVSAR